MMSGKQLAQAWWKARQAAGLTDEGEDMNLSLIQRPKRVSASSDTLYIYAPSVLMEGGKLKPKTIIKVLEVHDGDTPQETTIKVMDHAVWQEHWRNWYGRGGDQCKIALARQGEYDGATDGRPKCVCEGSIDDMPEKLRDGTHFILLSDIGK